ncbi:hypothetical protein EDB85DRAFT_2034719 [Lactarius pseudohatsudake]|nr:hypothetical protein EDB85DRAFT_2034719 [Lactarius pseudohatsudake]
MAKQHPIGSDSVENSESSSQFLDALRTHATDDLHTAAFESRPLYVPPSSVHANEPVIAPQNVDHENSNKVKQEEGVLSVARIKAQARAVRHSSHRPTPSLTNCLSRPRQTQTHTRPSRSARDAVRSGGGGDSYQCACGRGGRG